LITAKVTATVTTTPKAIGKLVLKPSVTPSAIDVSPVVKAAEMVGFTFYHLLSRIGKIV